MKERSTPLGDALQQYEYWRVNVAEFSPKTWAGEKSGLLGFVDFVCDLGALWVHELEPVMVEAWWVTRCGSLADSTRATRLSQLRSFLRFCIQREWLSYDPSALLRARKVIPGIRERLNATELLRLLDTTDEPRDRCLLAIASNLALRGGEIRRLTVGDVDLDAGEIRVTVDKTRENDVMPITSDLDSELRRWLTIYVPQGRTSYLIPSRHVAPTSRKVTYRPGSPLAEPEDVVKKALAELGWENTKNEGVHTIRRSVARIYFDMIEAETSYDSALLATMTMLHHTRPETTIKYIGRDRLTLARDAALKGRPFLTRLAAEVTPLRAVK